MANTLFEEIKGLEHAKRGLEVAIAGLHDVSLKGGPGTGKSMLMQACTDLVLKYYNTAFKYFVVKSDLTGFAHNKDNLSKDELLIVELQPCECGNYGSEVLPCWCTVEQLQAYLPRINQVQNYCPINIETARPEYYQLFDSRPGELTLAIGERILSAWAIQIERQGVLNQYIDQVQVKEYCHLADPGNALLKTAYAKLGLNPGQVFNILKVARTVADLAGSKEIFSHHVAEAIQYRTKRVSPVS
jgi:predicted ATPase with chaperone activity